MEMSDRNSSLALERGTTSDRRIGETTQQDGPQAREPSPGQHLVLMQAASVASAETIPGTNSISGQAPTRKSHIERLVDALHRSRRIQAGRVTRQYLHLVHDERS
jgi:hypothetical protein